MTRLGREALIAEATRVVAAKPQSSMADVAAEIGIGRTTLYRHFRDRETMIDEIAKAGARTFILAFLSAGPETGAGLEAVERICTQLFAIPDVLTLMFADHPIITDEVFAAVGQKTTEGGNTPDEDPLQAVIARGQRDGSINPSLPVAWASSYVYLTIAAGHLYRQAANSGGDASAQALDLTVRAIRSTLAN